MSRRALGTVALVGAGPGDPDLITVRALKHLQRADVILYDALANPALLQHAPPHARVLDVGKVPGGEQTPQELTCALLVEEARANKHVVRLKGGDPFVFGRGSEEALACARAGIAVEVVPGISSSVAAPAAAWTPVTHRGVASHFTVVTGAGGPSAPFLDDRWEALARAGGTLVFLMPVRSLDAIQTALLRGGLSPTTPCALVQAASRPDQRTVRTVLENLPDDARQNDVKSPAVLIVGEVVRIGAEIEALLESIPAQSSAPISSPVVVDVGTRSAQV